MLSRQEGVDNSATKCRAHCLRLWLTDLLGSKLGTSRYLICKHSQYSQRMVELAIGQLPYGLSTATQVLSEVDAVIWLFRTFGDNSKPV